MSSLAFNKARSVSASMVNTRIYVSVDNQHTVETRFFAHLERCLGVEVVLQDGNAGEGICIRSGCSSSDSCLILVNDWDRDKAGHRSENVRFSDDDIVPFPFRGRSVCTALPPQFNSLTLLPSERVLAQSASGAVLWAFSSEGGRSVFRSALPLPLVHANESLKEFFCGDRFIALLPLIDFIRSECIRNDADRGFPQIHACFMFDDPNLHAVRYGCVDYKVLAEHGAKANYHTAIATVPFDSWYTSKSAAEIFRRNPSQLSLLIHGNNHLTRELAQNYSARERRALLLESIKRIEYLERTSGLCVSRIMAAPHGACKAEMLQEMPRCSFEGATISHGSLRVHNANEEWTRDIGFSRSEFIKGCPVFPRWRLSLKSKADILLAVYLRQAIILVGHHGDLKNGVDLLSELAEFINGIGEVRWCSVQEIFHSAYDLRSKDGKVTVIPSSRHVKFRVPELITSLTISKPRGLEPGEWRIDAGGHTSVVPSGESLSVSVSEGVTVAARLVGSEYAAQAHRRTYRDVKVFTKSAARRLATEVRDRFLS